MMRGLQWRLVRAALDLNMYVNAKHGWISGVDGVDVVIGTSSFLREFSHGKDMAYITKTAIEVIEFVKSKGTS